MLTRPRPSEVNKGILRIYYDDERDKTVFHNTIPDLQDQDHSVQDQDQDHSVHFYFIY